MRIATKLLTLALSFVSTATFSSEILIINNQYSDMRYNMHGLGERTIKARNDGGSYRRSVIIESAISIPECSSTNAYTVQCPILILSKSPWEMSYSITETKYLKLEASSCTFNRQQPSTDYIISCN